MKKIFYILSLVGAMSLVACTDLEENLYGKLSPEGFYNDESEIEIILNSIYKLHQKNIARPYGGMEMKTAASDDILGVGSDSPGFNEVEINIGRTNNTDNAAQKGWERAYAIINVANSMILNLDNAQGKVAEATLNQYEAQARFFRAWEYFWLVRFFNNIPLVTTALEPDENREMVPSKAVEIYNLIIEDLKYCEQNLPISWAATNQLKHNGGAPTKGTASAVLAKVYLQMAGFPVNGGTQYYGLARDKAKEIIDNAATYGYGLMDNFYENWDAYWTPYRKDKEEVIFFCPVDATDGSVRSPLPSWPIEYGGWEMMVAEHKFYESFPEGDRKDFTFVTDFYVNGGQHVHYTELSAKHPFYRKMYADGRAGGWEWEKRNEPESMWQTYMNKSVTWHDIRDIIILRYADILLTYAEAKARTDGPDALAYQCLNDVRNRAYKGVGTTEASVSGLSTEEFIETVIWERAWEFAGMEHSSRWFDLVRLELVEKANTEWRNETEEKYQLVRPYTKANYFYETPSKEASLNPNLANNNAEFN